MKYLNVNFNVKILSVFILTVSLSFNAYAQNQKQFFLKLNHQINQNPVRNIQHFRYQPVPDTLFVYASRIQFATDTEPQTTGDGRFDLSSNYPDSVDAPPHDSLYFINHLEFLKNYFYKSSKGKLIIKYELIGGVRNLSGTMPDYSPRRGENLQRLGTLFNQTWTSVDSVYNFSGINVSKSAFIIFHAGTGRDVDLTSQGIFQGQLDIPSIFLGISTLKSIYGDTTQGFYTNDGIVIPSSSILPEQEYRIINSTFGDIFLELGLNGIICASIGSSLGLPDLFNTQTGITAIGRFGLMDGQSIFSFAGVFPPEPSAWEKQFLGWVDPIEIISDGTFSSRSASIDVNGNSSVYKTFISGKEYFLIENRNRDAKKNGQTIYFRKGNIVGSTLFIKDEDGFNFADIWKLKGDIVDVDELDWSLPGLKNDTANYQGGILVWHIDENVIDANFASNTINVNINHRGVDLEEAKGVQQIGVSVNTPFGVFTGDGTPYDFWYNGYHDVPSTIYQNVFNQTSFPNSKSYSNFPSRVCLSNFSVIDSAMTFTFQNCSPITNINNFPRFVGKDTSVNAQPIGFDYNGNGYDEIFVNVKDSLYGFRDTGNSIRVDMPNGFLKDSVAKFVVSFVTANSVKYVECVYNNKINLLSFTIDSVTGSPNIIQIINSNFFTSPSMYIQSDEIIYSGTSDGRINKLNPINLNNTFDSVSNRQVVSLAKKMNGNLPYYFIDETSQYLASASTNVNNPDSVTVANNQLRLNGIAISSQLGLQKINSSPVIADINKDGNQEIIFTADNKVFAINQYGVVIDNFPFSANGVSSISGGCAVADLNGDGIFEVIFGTNDGRVYAYGIDGKIVEGFPLLAGGKITSTPAIINSNGNFGLAVYSQDGYLYGWKTPWTYDSTKILWKNFLRDKFHSNSNFDKFTAANTSPCLSKDKVYNWPNPVYGSTTNIRYFLNTSGTSVKVRVMDLSGELVTTLTGSANQGFDNEVIWNVSNVQSGIYIAVLELEGGSCSEKPSIKIAVVK